MTSETPFAAAEAAAGQGPALSVRGVRHAYGPTVALRGDVLASAPTTSW